MLRELKCPACSAPIEAIDAKRIVCRYCGAALVADQEDAGPTETHYLVSLQVAPSNVDRIVRLLVEQAGIEGAAARKLVMQPRCEIDIGCERGRAQELARAANEDGAQAEVTSKEVPIPIVDVLLESYQGNKLAVIVAIRQHLDLGIREAKEMVETAPTVVVSAIDERKTGPLIAALEAAGATVRTLKA